MKEKRDEALKLVKIGDKKDPSCKLNEDQSMVSFDGVKPPTTVEVKEVDGGLQVFLISKSGRNFPLSKVISIVEDGGAEVVKSGYTTVGDEVIHTLHAKVQNSYNTLTNFRYMLMSSHIFVNFLFSIFFFFSCRQEL